MPVPVPAVVAVLVSVVTVADVSVPRPLIAGGVAAVFLDLSLRQQAGGLPPARASVVLLVLPIELPINRSIDHLIEVKELHEYAAFIHQT